MIWTIWSTTASFQQKSTKISRHIRLESCSGFCNGLDGEYLNSRWSARCNETGRKRLVLGQCCKCPFYSIQTLIRLVRKDQSTFCPWTRRRIGGCWDWICCFGRSKPSQTHSSRRPPCSRRNLVCYISDKSNGVESIYESSLIKNMETSASRIESTNDVQALRRFW